MHRIQVIGDAGQRRHVRLVLAARRQMVGHAAGDEIVILVLCLRQQLMPAIEQRLMRAVGLVQAEDVEIDIQRLHVERPVRRIGNAIDEDQRPGRMHHPGNRRDVVDGADDVRAMGNADQPGPAVQQRLQGRQLKLPGLRIDAPFPDRRPGRRRQPAPGADIAFMVLVGDDDLVTRTEPAAHRLRQHIGQLRRRRADDDLIVAGVDPVGHQIGGIVHRLGGAARQVIFRAMLHPHGGEIPAHPVHHRLRHIGAAGILEEGPGAGLGVGEAGKLAADEIEIKDGQEMAPGSSAMPLRLHQAS